MRLFLFLMIVASTAFYLFWNLEPAREIIEKNIPISKPNILLSDDLKVGATGEDVKILQVALSQDESLYPSGIVSGYFGQLTKQAVTNFQVRYNLPATGEVDMATADEFNKIYGNNSREYYLSLVPEEKTLEITLNKPPAPDSEEWGKAKQISEHTWTMRIGFDDVMATSSEIFEALNTYRVRHGKNSLQWDDRLASYALSRAKYFTQIGNLDEHAGFSEYVKDENNVKSLGFWALGENSSYGYRLNGTHLIEWVYAGDEPHDLNQLNSMWTHVGIGVDGHQTNLIFGGQQM